MSIVILTVDHVYANKLVKDTINHFGDDVDLVVESAVLLHNKSFFQAIRKYIRISGLDYVIAQAVKLQIYRFLSFFASRYPGIFKLAKFYSYRKLAEQKHIDVLKPSNINDDKAYKIIKKKKPRIIVSIFFNQILKDRIIKIPSKGVINIHPAYLPNYKGVSPVFWSLANGEKSAGVTVHFIDSGVDTGRIIARKRVKILKNDNEDSLYWKIVNLGSPLLISSIKKVLHGGAKTIANKGGVYFSLPTQKAVTKYRQKRKIFFDLAYYLKVE